MIAEKQKWIRWKGRSAHDTSENCYCPSPTDRLTAGSCAAVGNLEFVVEPIPKSRHPKESDHVAPFPGTCATIAAGEDVTDAAVAAASALKWVAGHGVGCGVLLSPRPRGRE